MVKKSKNISVLVILKFNVWNWIFQFSPTQKKITIKIHFKAILRDVLRHFQVLTNVDNYWVLLDGKLAFVNCIFRLVLKMIQTVSFFYAINCSKFAQLQSKGKKEEFNKGQIIRQILVFRRYGDVRMSINAYWWCWYKRITNFGVHEVVDNSIGWGFGWHCDNITVTIR
jgi:hypothetical protein